MLKVALAMSGGVDSSVAAVLLKENGYQVIGVTMEVWPSEDPAGEVTGLGDYCGIDAVSDARRVALKLGIPHYVMNFRDIFALKVVDYFCQEYSRGRTPNPCIRCNQYIKFGAFIDRAKELDADFIATGHYARVEEFDGRFVLAKGMDSGKDQSYALYTMTQDKLRCTLMPLGSLTKETVRQISRDMGLPVTDKQESQDICFISGDDYTSFLEGRIPEAAKPGPIIDSEGNVLGEHRGIIRYTVGQRRGLGIAAKEPLYVRALDWERNAVIIGARDGIYGEELLASNVNWIANGEPSQPIAIEAKIRYRHREAEALVEPMGNDRAYVKFKEPQMAITPGQAVVFYQRDLVVGGGTIERVGRFMG